MLDPGHPFCLWLGEATAPLPPYPLRRISGLRPRTGEVEDAPVTTERPDPPLIAGEREMLRGFLDLHRATLAVKCEGLSDEELRRQSMPPSTLTLLGLVRHMAEVERAWFRRVIDGEDVPLVWSADGTSRSPTTPPRHPGGGLRRLAGRGRALPPHRGGRRPWTSSSHNARGEDFRCGRSCCT